MLNALAPWLYEGDPIGGMAFEAPLNAVKGQPKGYFESLIKKHLIDNPHRTSLQLIPDPEEGKRKEAAETERLARARAAMTSGQIEKLLADVAGLKKHQETPDSLEALASLPALKLSDLEREVKTIPLEVSELHGAKLLTHNLPTNGILYLDLGFDLHNLLPASGDKTADLLPFVGLMGRALLQMGTQTQDYVALTQRIGKSTGGIRAEVLASAIRESQNSALYFFLRGKATTDKAQELLDILKDVLLTTQLDNRERFKQIVLEDKAGAEAGLIPGGHLVVKNRLSARFSEADWVTEQISGIENLFFLRQLAEEIEKDWDSVLGKLETVRRLLLNRASMIVNVTLDSASFGTLSPALTALIEALPALEVKGQKPNTPAFNIKPSTLNEGLTIPAQVNYVGKGANLYALGYEPHGSLHVIRRYLGTTWLWDKIRTQGGAYGGFSTFDIATGTFAYLSYRDPNLLASLDNYDATPAFLRSLDLSESELTKTIIGASGMLDPYLLPDAKGWTSMVRHLTNYTDEVRQQIRDEALGASPDDFKRFADVLEQVVQKGEIVVLGSADAIEKANQERAGLLKVKKVM
jgi:presequence protease